jgi:sulfur carrier protein ThiS
MIKVNVSRITSEDKTIELKEGTAGELIKKLDTNDDAVIVVGENGEIYTKDKKLKDGSKVNLIEVFSGG